MHGLPSWVALLFFFLSFFACDETKRTEEKLSLSLCVPLFFTPLFSLPVIYACLHIVSIQSLFHVFFLCVLVFVIFTSSLDALTMQAHSSSDHVHCFSTRTTIVCCHKGIHGNLGTKHKPTLLWWWSQRWAPIQKAIISNHIHPWCATANLKKKDKKRSIPKGPIRTKLLEPSSPTLTVKLALIFSIPEMQLSGALFVIINE